MDGSDLTKEQLLALLEKFQKSEPVVVAAAASSSPVVVAAAAASPLSTATSPLFLSTPPSSDLLAPTFKRTAARRRRAVSNKVNEPKASAESVRTRLDRGPAYDTIRHHILDRCSQQDWDTYKARMKHKNTVPAKRILLFPDGRVDQRSWSSELTWSQPYHQQLSRVVSAAVQLELADNNIQPLVSIDKHMKDIWTSVMRKIGQDSEKLQSNTHAARIAARRRQKRESRLKTYEMLKNSNYEFKDAQGKIIASEHVKRLISFLEMHSEDEDDILRQQQQVPVPASSSSSLSAAAGESLVSVKVIPTITVRTKTIPWRSKIASALIKQLDDSTPHKKNRCIRQQGTGLIGTLARVESVYLLKQKDFEWALDTFCMHHDLEEQAAVSSEQSLAALKSEPSPSIVVTPPSESQEDMEPLEESPPSSPSQRSSSKRTYASLPQVESAADNSMKVPRLTESQLTPPRKLPQANTGIPKSPASLKRGIAMVHSAKQQMHAATASFGM